MAQALNALGGSFFIQDRGHLACRDPQPPIEGDQADLGPPSKEHELELQVLLN